METRKHFATARSGSRRAESRSSHQAQSDRGIDPRALSIFQIDVLAPEQYYATFQRRLHLSPEKILMLAILQDAVTCFQCYVGSRHERKRRLYLEAETWILDEDRLYAFSFENVCDALGLDANFLRRGLMRWKAQLLLGMARSSPASAGQVVKERMLEHSATIPG